MAGRAFVIGSLAAAAGFYKFIAAPHAHDVLGIGRVAQPFNNQQCEHIPELRGCEDFWVHHDTGLLYAACAEPNSRVNWLPAGYHLNTAKRPLDDAIYVLDTRGEGPYSSRLTKLKTPGFSGNNGDGTFNLHGINGIVVKGSGSSATIRLFINNHRPTLGADGQPVDNYKTGQNSTVEIFETSPGSDSLKHIRTFADPLIRTPNRVAPAGPDSFVASNDHTFKTGPNGLLVSSIWDVAYHTVRRLGLISLTHSASTGV